jgi:type I restriction enzyme S subunit
MEPTYWRRGTVPWLSSSKVNDHVVETPSELVTDRAVRECSISLVPRGSVIIGLVGQGKTRGKAAILGIEACISQNIAAIVPAQDLSGSYLQLFLTAFYRTIREFGRGGNQEALNCEIVSNLRVSIPPPGEQRAILDRIDSLTQIIAQRAATAHREISLLRELRTHLIADVVTGKLDVREAAARLPDEAEEPEVVDDLEGDPVAEEPVDDLDPVPEEAEA